MSASEKHENNKPAVLGGDLPEKQAIALEEGHDADIPSTLEDRTKSPTQTDPVETTTSKNPDSLTKEASADGEKTTDRHSSLSSSPKNGERDVEKGQAEAMTEPVDPNIVDWEGSDDPENPYNWPAKKKWWNIAILSMLTFLIPLASSMFAPGVPLVMQDFGTTE